MHLIWIVDTGSHYMNDVITLGRLFYPFGLPYAMLAATLSLLYGVGRVEKVSAILLFGLIVVALCQGMNIKVDGDRVDLFRSIRGQFEPKHSWAPWFVIGLCFQQAIVALFKRHKYLKQWFFPLAGFVLVYATIGYAYIASRIHQSFPLSATLQDAVLVFCIGSVVSAILNVPLMKFYDMPITVFPFQIQSRAQPEDRQVFSESAPSASSEKPSS